MSLVWLPMKDIEEKASAIFMVVPREPGDPRPRPRPSECRPTNNLPTGRYYYKVLQCVLVSYRTVSYRTVSCKARLQFVLGQFYLLSSSSFCGDRHGDTQLLRALRPHGSFKLAHMATNRRKRRRLRRRRRLLRRSNDDADDAN